MRNTQWKKQSKLGAVSAFISLMLVLVACGGVAEVRPPMPGDVPEDAALSEEPYDLFENLLVSTDADRSSPKVLDMSVVTGDAYLSFAKTEGVTQVRLYTDDPERQEAPYASFSPTGLTTESGTEAVDVLETAALEDGMHTVTAEVSYADGTTETDTAAFLVDNSGELADRLLVSKRTDRRDAQLLGDTALSGNAYVFVVPSTRVDQVNFYIDDAGRSGSPDQVERIPYYDLAGTANGGSAQAFDTSDLKNGDHSFTAEIVSSTGRKTVISKTAKVSNSTTTSSPSPTSKSKYALRGDPGFSRSDLSSSQREWYDALWEAINNPDQIPNANSLAKSGDSYLYRGDLQNNITSLLLAFRMTGDLKLLDKVDRLAEVIRDELRDAWLNGSKDGFVGWLNEYDRGTSYYGKDTQMAYDLKANALVAEIAWVLQNNRDLKSPSGANYGAHADFWKDYLVNDFEAKWRKRNGVQKGFPFATYAGLHTYHSFMKWHHYMGKLTGNGGYSNEAERMADVLWKENFRETSSDYGTALVWPKAVLSLTGNDIALETQTYARYVVMEAVDLHFEGFNKYASGSSMRKMANAVADFMIDDSSFESFARDIGGGKSRAGIPASSTSWSRMTEDRFAESGWVFLLPWAGDTNGRFEKAARAVFYKVENQKYNQTPRRVFIPTGMLLKEMLD